MPPILNSISKRIFFTLGILVFNIGIIAVLSLVFLFKTRSVGSIGQDIDNQRIRIIKLIKTDLDVLRFESVNQQFYETGQSDMVRERDSLWNLIRTRNTDLRVEMEENEFLIDYQFHQIDSLLTDYSETFRTLLRKINERGFKDYGQEGIMRAFAHQLETTNVISPTKYLTLRRHEKDFLLRKESRYVDEFNELADQVQADLGPTSRPGIVLLNNYRNAFNKLADINYEIGITPGDGLLGSLSMKTQAVSRHLEELTLLSQQRIEVFTQRSMVVFTITSVLTVALSIILTFYTSARLARPIKKLSSTMGKFMVNEGFDEDELKSDEETNEIANLSQAFVKLSKKLKTQFAEIQSQNRELKKLNEELDRFIYSAAHDLKSPLASMEGLVILAEKEINNPQHAHYFRMMTSSLRKLESFIRDITDYAKNKRQSLKIETIEIEAQINEIVDSLKFLPDANKISMSLQIKSSAEFHSDKTRLGIIMKNLLSNAFRYLDTTKTENYVVIEGQINEQNLVLKITDNGIGIEEKHLPRIYDMFYRAVEHSQGTGIGLFLVRETVRMLRGKIAVKSKLGEWTIFYLTLPNLKDNEAVIETAEPPMESMIG
ncbi:MAG TPA: HAMP domain-containing sensor histidine kinase [Cyclobacteriaceae bacterium]|nr:HAMP domain-containing sensor histidine kinase [Cyclobacteriaceae bacterium]